MAVALLEESRGDEPSPARPEAASDKSKSGAAGAAMQRSFYLSPRGAVLGATLLSAGARMRRLSSTLIVCTAIVALAACDRQGGDGATSAAPTAAQNVARACKDVDLSGMPGADAPEPRGGYTATAERDSLLRLIEAGEARWRAARPPGYLMTVVASCFCRDRGQPVVLRVYGDSVIASRDTTGQQSWPDDWRAGLHVAGLFKEARQFACDSTRTTRLTLDARLGYPRRLLTESRLEMSDTDREYRVLSFAAEDAGR
jgi:hypothetical protein